MAATRSFLGATAFDSTSAFVLFASAMASLASALILRLFSPASSSAVRPTLDTLTTTPANVTLELSVGRLGLLRCRPDLDRSPVSVVGPSQLVEGVAMPIVERKNQRDRAQAEHLNDVGPTMNSETMVTRLQNYTRSPPGVPSPPNPILHVGPGCGVVVVSG